MRRIFAIFLLSTADVISLLFMILILEWVMSQQWIVSLENIQFIYEKVMR